MGLMTRKSIPRARSTTNEHIPQLPWYKDVPGPRACVAVFTNWPFDDSSLTLLTTAVGGLDPAASVIQRALTHDTTKG